jgi:F-type H+-transporting ATPase subunit epsilon
MASSDKALKLDIVTPQKLFFSGEVTSIIAPGLNGLFQILKGHAPLLAALKSGKVRVSLPDRTENTFQIADGFFEVSGNKAILLTEDIS